MMMSQSLLYLEKRQLAGLLRRCLLLSSAYLGSTEFFMRTVVLLFIACQMSNEK